MKLKLKYQKIQPEPEKMSLINLVLEFLYGREEKQLHTFALRLSKNFSKFIFSLTSECLSDCSLSS